MLYPFPELSSSASVPADFKRHENANWRACPDYFARTFLAMVAAVVVLGWHIAGRD